MDFKSRAGLTKNLSDTQSFLKFVNWLAFYQNLDQGNFSIWFRIDSLIAFSKCIVRQVPSKFQALSNREAYCEIQLRIIRFQSSGTVWPVDDESTIHYDSILNFSLERLISFPLRIYGQIFIGNLLLKHLELPTTCGVA